MYWPEVKCRKWFVYSILEKERRKIKWQNGIWIVKNSCFCMIFWFDLIWFFCGVWWKCGQTNNKINNNNSFFNFFSLFFPFSIEIVRFFSIHRQFWVQRTHCFFSRKEEETEESPFSTTLIQPHRKMKKRVFYRYEIHSWAVSIRTVMLINLKF